MKLVRSLVLAALSAALLAAPPHRYFRIVRKEGISWLQSPKGERLFANGVNLVDRVGAPERLRAWRFNTLGAWTDTALESSGMPFSVELHIGGSLGVPWIDLFSPNFARSVGESAASATARYRGNPLLIGYFPDNELGWWGPTIFLYHLQQPPKSSTRQRLFRLLREHYRGNFRKLQEDFETPDAKAWADLESATALRFWLRPGHDGIRVVSRFTEILAERYYAVVCDALRRADPGRLILGDRYQSYYDPAVVRAAGRHLDVISTNYAADFLDGSLAHYFLGVLHRISGRPVLISEYYFCARENRSGNSNRGDTFPVVTTQGQRAKSFERNLTALASNPDVVGADWFQYRDEPAGGRPSDGEDYNMGLVDTVDRPYEELVGAASRIDVASLHRSASDRTGAAEIEPPTALASPSTGLAEWPRDRAFVTPLSPEAPADLYLCRGSDGLWLGLTFMDYSDPKLYRDDRELERDLPSLEIESGAKTVRVQALVAGGARVSDPAIHADIVRAGTRYTFILRLPLAERMFCRLRSTAGAWRAEWRVQLPVTSVRFSFLSSPWN